MYNENINIISSSKKDYHNINKIIKLEENGEIEIHWKDSNIEKLTKEIEELQEQERALNDQLEPYRAQMKQLDDDAKRNLDKVHQYNEIKDSCQAIIGKLAELEGLTIAQMNKKLGIDENDDKKK
ncbi:hypothetical protein DICPUDRAFT_78588 [Dictyostelium purpureum]|uniref:Swi5-domain-containing protein n=1 Tax=Dictyostelium purpureum TaxID=5786 RepID=F0ZK00_DICPU|nr:uncharacterized protein DICPUDRAFT_78588 [Dictyostelium purpureum]EGC35735.1 hypothetical protein DICPUDRAFT_78588 [Dictyostelium purpureum]|eukprot:XP_003287738.1 hypothetical protein DICPUDRAFT_78588 [Dictyostelium purpureum]